MTLHTKIFLVCLAAAAIGVHAQATDPALAVEQPRIIRGNDQVLAPISNKGQISGTAAGLKFEEAPLADVVSLILREIAKVDYVIHPPINGTVTLATQGEISSDQAVLLLEAALQANGLQMARDTRGVYHIGRPDALKGIVPSIRQAGGSGPLPPGHGAIVVPLKYIGAGEMASILQPLAGPGAIVRVDPVRNMLVLVGTRNQAEGWLDLVATFDVDMLKGMSVGVFPLKHVSTSEVEAALRLLSAGSGAAASAAPPANPSAGAATSAPASFGVFGAMRILPIARINSVMVVTPRAAYLDEARKWIEKLDQPGGNSAETQLFVYAVQNGNAKHLADVLNGLFGGAGGASAQAGTSGVAPGLRQATATTTGFSGASLGLSGGAAGNRAASGSTVQGSGLTSLTLPGGLRVMADEINNAVLIYGTRGDYEKIQITLKRLDVPPTQVLIEASIIEVTLNDDLKYGLQWAFTDKARHALSGSGVLSNATNTVANVAGAVGTTVFGGTPAGFSYTLANSLGDVRAVLNALADKSLVKVISSPSLMVLDNYTASIAVGNQQPVQVGETITTGGNVSSNIQYKDTGVSLTVTPSVNAGNMVTMQLSQAVTDVGAVDAATGQRSFLQRQFASKVAVRSGETLVLGGLIRDNTTNGRKGVPGLVDIPLFGSLFGTTATNTNRTELVVLITPRVMRTTQDTREIGQELKDRMKSLFPTVALPLPQDETSSQEPYPTKP